MADDKLFELLTPPRRTAVVNIDASDIGDTELYQPLLDRDSATVVATWLFYEPLLLSLTRGTIGHYLCNVRVVDDRVGNISLIKAFAHMIIKSLLGWYSFLAWRLQRAIRPSTTF